MALNFETVGKVWGPYEFSYDERDLIIYALGIGYGKEALEYIYEGAKDFKAFPTYGVILPSNAGVEAFLSTKANFAMVVHGEQTLRVHTPLPRKATVVTTAALEGIYDKGSGALIVMRFDSKDKKGTAHLQQLGGCLCARGRRLWRGRPTQKRCARDSPGEPGFRFRCPNRSEPSRPLPYVRRPESPAHRSGNRPGRRF